MVGSVFLFTVACAALLGSPGPGIAALIAVGRAQGLTGGIGFFVAMQIGLALAAGLSALGLAGFLHAAPALRTMLSVASVLYLVWLAWQIASQPVSGGADGRAGGRPAGIAMGFALGFANPKPIWRLSPFSARSSFWNQRLRRQTQLPNGPCAWQ